VYFGNTDPIGKVLYFNERLPFTITGVFEDIPQNSSIPFHFLLSWSTMPYNGWVKKEGDFSSPWTFTFVKLRQEAKDIVAVNEALTRLANEHISNLEKRGHKAQHTLRPYESLHTSSELSGEIKPAISKTLLYALVSLAIFVLIAAWINYVNLSLAQSLERADEIGVRKVFGASRSHISGQFFLEAFILSFITFLLGLGLYQLVMKPMAGIMFGNIRLEPLNLQVTALYLIAFVVATAVISFYPTHFLSKYKPVSILKNKFNVGHGKANLLFQGLMVFQLFLAVAVLGLTLIATRQVSYMRNFNAGFDADHTISLRAPASTNSDSLRYTRFLAFRADVLQLPAFKAGAASFNIPGQEIRFHDESVYSIGSSNEKKQSFWEMWIDDGYQETFGMTLLAGRNFREREFGNTCLINESAARALGFVQPGDAVNTEIIARDKTYTIVGVWKDYHHESVRKSVDPIVFYHRHPFEYGYYSFKLGSFQGDYLNTLQTIWSKHYPNDQFVFYFMNAYFQQQYQNDALFSQLLKVFSYIAVVVACLGLFGMASLTMVKRKREIGVRKVLGASVGSIVMLLSKTYAKLVGIGCLVAFPVAFYIATLWLREFAYKIPLSLWMILLPGVVVLGVTLLTISFQAMKAAFTNPVTSLRDQ
jgi:putative ABC transport system permease protein